MRSATRAMGTLALALVLQSVIAYGQGGFRPLPPLLRALARRGQVADLRPLFRGGRYFEALMILTSRIRQIIEENPPHG